MICIRQKRARAIARGVEHCLQLVPARMPATEQASAATAIHRRKRLLLSISAALMAGLVAWPTIGAAVIYIEPITGVAGNDGVGGTGGYDPAYDVNFIDGVSRYSFVDGDSIELEAIDRDLVAVSIASGNPPVALDVAGGGRLDLSASRGESTRLVSFSTSRVMTSMTDSSASARLISTGSSVASSRTRAGKSLRLGVPTFSPTSRSKARMPFSTSRRLNAPQILRR